MKGTSTDGNSTKRVEGVSGKKKGFVWTGQCGRKDLQITIRGGKGGLVSRGKKKRVLQIREHRRGIRGGHRQNLQLHLQEKSTVV